MVGRVYIDDFEKIFKVRNNTARSILIEILNMEFLFREEVDAVLVFSVHNSQIPREASLGVLEELIMQQCLLGKTYHHAIYEQAGVILRLELMIADMKERHALCRVVEYSGNNSVCVKCRKQKHNLHIRNENCDIRCKENFESFVSEVQMQLAHDSNEITKRKKIDLPEKK